MLAGVLLGGVWAGIAGLLKAVTGTNEVITTIMLNWIALWVGVWLVNLNGPLQNTEQKSVPVSPDIAEGAKLPVFWGDAQLQGLHVGLFVALASLLVFWVLLNRSVTGYEVRAVGFNPDAAEYGGISVGRNYVKVMAVCGAFAGLAGALDILGWQFRLATNDIQANTYGFLGIAVALLGRNRPVGIALAALLFAFLDRSQVPLQIEQFPSSVVTIIQGTIVLAVVVANEVATRLARRAAERGAAKLPTLLAGDGSDEPSGDTLVGRPGTRPEVQA
jgi:simple sugar transport system permease protein